MPFMVIVKATKDSENEGASFDPQLMADMNKFNDELLEDHRFWLLPFGPFSCDLTHCAHGVAAVCAFRLSEATSWPS